MLTMPNSSITLGRRTAQRCCAPCGRSSRSTASKLCPSSDDGHFSTPQRKDIDMTTNWKDLARATLEGSESGAMTFPQNLRILMEAGFDGYAVDFRRSTRTYYMPNGETLELTTQPTPT